MGPYDINEDEMNPPITQIITMLEGKTLDFKRNHSSPDNMLKSLVAFSNSAGGRLLIGVEEEPVVLTQEAGPGRDQVGIKSGLSPEQVKILDICSNASGIKDLIAVTGRSNRTKFRDQVLRPLLSNELIEMTVPDKPSSSKQKYRLTERGRAALNTEQEK